jgi:predicted TIM-barrel fold metal-dependent hydrolase
MDHVTIVSADGHIGMPYSGFNDYIDPQFRDQLSDLAEEQQFYEMMLIGQVAATAPEVAAVVDERGVGALRQDLYWDIDKRLAEMDAEGLAGEFVIVSNDLAPFFSIMNKPYDVELRKAGVQAYNRWAAEFMARSGGRIFANGENLPDQEGATAQLPWLAEHGFKSVTVPGLVLDKTMPPIYDPSWDPYWAACADLGLVLNVHAGWGTRQGLWHEFFSSFVTQMMESGGSMMLDDLEVTDMLAATEALDAKNPDSPLAMTVLPHQVLWRLMLSGVFDRHPDLKLVLTEVRGDWAPSLLDYLDKRFNEAEVKPKLRPREYWERNCGVTPSAHHRSEVRIRHEIGIDQFMFGADIPHPEGTWPNTQQWLRDSLNGVPEDEVRKILGENAIRIYGIDRGPMDEAAARIGLTFSDVTSSIELDERVVKHFHSRAGYTRDVDEVDFAKIDERLLEDLQRISTAAH